MGQLKHYIRRLAQGVKLGDKVERVTKAFGVQPCGGCVKRKNKLNGKL